MTAGILAPSATVRHVDFGRVAHMAVENVCPWCGQRHTSPVFTEKKYDAWIDAWKRGVHVQSFWPEMSPAEREEFFISGICDACWPKEEEDDA